MQQNASTERDQVPLGKQLLDARLEKKLSRAQVAEMADISENSLIRYEKAGVSEDGQYPPAQKLAMLWLALDLNPADLLMGSLSEDAYWQAEGRTFDEYVFQHPAFRYVDRQFDIVLRDNQKLWRLTERLLEGETEDAANDAENVEWLKSEVRSIIRRYRNFENRMIDLGLGWLPDIATLAPAGMKVTPERSVYDVGNAEPPAEKSKKRAQMVRELERLRDQLDE